jgi:hypothetical protein
MMEEGIKSKEGTKWINVRHIKYEQLFKGEITMQEYINFIEDFYKEQTDKINTVITDDKTIT